MTPDPADYPAHSTRVAATLAQVQPPNGTDYFNPAARATRERIAVNVHQGLPPLAGVDI